MKRARSHESSTTTEVAPLTAGGAIVGTLHYMSPEQIEGKKVDQRSDIFLLGVLLYEMATGRRPFEGSSRASILAAILSNDPPPMSALRPDAPPALVRIISVALEKDPERRWQSAHDIAQQLRWIAESKSPLLPSAVGSRAVVSAVGVDARPDGSPHPRDNECDPARSNPQVNSGSGRDDHADSAVVDPSGQLRSRKRTSPAAFTMTTVDERVP